VIAAERVGITPIVRTPGFDPAFILPLGHGRTGHPGAACR
jgi:hypothetical protein